MRTAGVLIAIALALALQTTLARFVVGGVGPFDDFSRRGHEPTAKFHAKWLKL